jgi:hypothetical protein
MSLKISYFRQESIIFGDFLSSKAAQIPVVN